MSNFNLKSFSSGTTHQDILRERSRELVHKWRPTGLLEGLDTETEVNSVALLLENQYTQLMQEATRTGTAENSEEWSGVALPLVRRIFGEIVAKEFVSVQPMNLPTGLIFFLDFKYGSNQPGFNDGESLFGETEVEDLPSGGLYGRGRFGYSVNAQVESAVAVEEVNEVSKARIEFDENLTEIVDDLREAVVTLPERTDIEAVKAFTFEADDVVEYFPRHTRFVQTNQDGTHDVAFVVRPDSASGYDAAQDDAEIEYSVQPVSFDRGDFEDRSTNPDISGTAGFGDDTANTGYESLDIPEVDLDVTSIPITAKTRKLKAVWTPELAQDLNAFHAIDAEAELTSILSEYVSMEIDLEILDMLIRNSLTREFWSTRPGFEYDPNVGDFVDENSHTGTKNEWFQTLGNKLQRMSNRIHQKTMRGGANFVVTSPDVASILESIEGFRVDTGGDEFNYAMGVQRVGTLYERYTVYKNPYMKENYMLVGFRGSNFLETGAVYAPYIPLIMTPLVYDPNNMTPRRAVMTRYAKRMVRPEFYGLLIVDKPSRI